MEIEVYKLCYVSNGYAYFTTQPLSKQWGDDWNDSPYEHNAGEPYEPFRSDLSIEERYKKFPDDWFEDGTPRWKIIKIGFNDWDFKYPCTDHCNSPYSVEKINKGIVPWLETYNGNIEIMAGTTLYKFIEILNKLNIELYYPINSKNLSLINEIVKLL